MRKTSEAYPEIALNLEKKKRESDMFKFLQREQAWTKKYFQPSLEYQTKQKLKIQGQATVHRLRMMFNQKACANDQKGQNANKSNERPKRSSTVSSTTSLEQKRKSSSKHAENNTITSGISSIEKSSPNNNQVKTTDKFHKHQRSPARPDTTLN